MRLDRLVAELERAELLPGSPPDVEITSITHDSRSVKPGALFCCIEGGRADGHDFATEAAAAGAAALLCRRRLDVHIPQVVVPDTRRAMAHAASALHGHPSRRLTVVGVTGTNGKTTTTHLLQSVLRADGRRTEVIGTLSGTRTTPEADELQARLARLADAGTQAVAMEVSSHALAQHRVDATWFAMAVFTNLSQDHLDFHGTMEDYFRAKASLFDPERSAGAVVNADDPYGRLLLRAARIPTRPFSLADAAGLDLRPAGTTFLWHGQEVKLPPGGRLHVMNALAAATTAHELGVPPATIAQGLASAPAVAGRFQIVEGRQPFRVVVDYAHTPAALEEVLAAARQLSDSGRVAVVFGCGGDRDPGKRPLMGEVATRMADLVVLTNDNPRHENPDEIATQVVAGAQRRDNLVQELDRRAAIALALEWARAGDVIVVAGKGHERMQVIGQRQLPFDDVDVVHAELARRGWA